MVLRVYGVLKFILLEMLKMFALAMGERKIYDQATGLLTRGALQPEWGRGSRATAAGGRSRSRATAAGERSRQGQIS
jgi:hypothetical protein